jgi:hypothetical protein
MHEIESFIFNEFLAELRTLKAEPIPGEFIDGESYI